MICKIFSKVLFADPTEQALNVYYTDMGQEQAQLAIEGDSVELLDTAYGVVQSPNLYVRATLTVSIVKDRPKYSTYVQRSMTNGVINGTITLTDDARQTYVMRDCVLNMPKAVSTNGSEANVDFEIKGVILANTDLIQLLS